MIGDSRAGRLLVLCYVVSGISHDSRAASTYYGRQLLLCILVGPAYVLGCIVGTMVCSA